MSGAKAKAIRKALREKGVRFEATGYKAIQFPGSVMVYANPERRVYKALKRLPREQALATIAGLKKPQEEIKSTPA